MELLITKETVAEKLQVAIGYDDEEFKTFINEAQIFDFKPLVREDFFSDLIAKKNEPEYAKLLEGGEYTFENRTYFFQGIDTVLSYFTYARYYLNSPGVATSHGVVYKTTPNSTPVPLEDRRNVYYKKKQEANELFADCVRYIERNISLFPSFSNQSGCGANSSRGRVSTTVIQ